MSALESFRASFEVAAKLQAEADELAARITQMASVDLPAAELALDAARTEHKAVAGASVLGEAQDAAVRKARATRIEAEEKREGLLSAIETLRARERELHAKQREAKTEQRKLAAQIAEPLLANSCEDVRRLVPGLIAALRRVAQLTALTENGFPTGHAFVRKTGDLAGLFRDGRLLLQTDGIFPDFRDGLDDLTPEELLGLAEPKHQGWVGWETQKQ